MGNEEPHVFVGDLNRGWSVHSGHCDVKKKGLQNVINLKGTLQSKECKLVNLEGIVKHKCPMSFGKPRTKNPMIV